MVRVANPLWVGKLELTVGSSVETPTILHNLIPAYNVLFSYISLLAGYTGLYNNLLNANEKEKYFHYQY